MSLSWDEVIAYGLGLPDVELAPHYGAPSLKTNGRAFVAPGREQGSFCLLIDRDTVAMLMDTDPDTYWQTPHYAGYPAVLVRLDSDDPERVLAMVDRARERARSLPRPKPRQKKA